MNIQPNSFIIGVQKSGTTSLNYWLSQHPEVFGSVKLKDVDFFLHPHASEKMFEILEEEYKAKHPTANENIKEPIVLLSSVNYCYYPAAIAKIAELYPSSKLIIMLRNPAERAISAYRYYRKLFIEKRPITDAFNYDYSLTEDKFIFTPENHAFTYIEHGLYYSQIERIYSYFRKEQLLIVDFDEMEKEPRKMLQSVYKFFNIREDFYPSFEAKNVTGKAKFAFLYKIAESKNPVKKWFVKYFIKSWLSFSNRRGVIKKLRYWNTTKTKQSFSEEELKVIDKLKKIYKEDTIKLDTLLSTDFLKKWNLA